MNPRLLVLLGIGLLIGVALVTGGSPALAQTPFENDPFESPLIAFEIPFHQFVNLAEATLEDGEPVPSCVWDTGAFGHSVWYEYTAPVDQKVAVIIDAPYPTAVGIYQGNELSALSEVNCRQFYDWYSGRRYHLQSLTGGEKYRFQYATVVYDIWPSEALFALEAPPPPVAVFNVEGQAAAGIPVLFGGWYSNDPAGATIVQYQWDFGDGTTASDSSSYVYHTFAADGDYTVSLTVTTEDGRTGTTQQVVQVRTHDVGIKSLSAPQAARAGQTKQISVAVKNTRYEERVSVSLYANDRYVGNLQQTVPVRNGNRTTDFAFSYTFTQVDAQMGKVTFRAEAWLENYYDPFPSDNSAIASPPTKVSGAAGGATVAGVQDEPGFTLLLPAIAED
jgi:hypothetical protein